MALDIYIYQFDKKNNSTKRPASGSEIGVYAGSLIKDACSILTPQIKLSLGTATVIPNYAYIPIWNRYYFVTNIQWDAGVWIMTLKVDAMATWKTQIGAQSLYVLRSASSYNGKIMDNLYPATSEPTYAQVIQESLFNTTNITTGMFVVGIAGLNTTYYKFTYLGLQAFLAYIMSPVYAADLTDDWSLVFSSLNYEANPLQYITSMQWFPFMDECTGISSIRVGFVDVPVAAGIVTGSGLIFMSYSITPPKHPQAASRGEYLNNAPYSSYELFIPPFGQINLDPTLIANTTDLECLIGMDMRTGKGTLSILDNDNTVLTSWMHAQISIPYQTTQIMTQGTFDLSKALGMAGSMLPAIATANAGGAAAGLISGVGSMIGDFAKGMIPSAKTLGSMGGMNSLRGDVALQCEFKMLVNEDLENRGRPLCQVKMINTLSGFIMVTDADVEIAAMESEQQEIRNYLQGGFFYE